MGKAMDSNPGKLGMTAADASIVPMLQKKLQLGMS